MIYLIVYWWTCLSMVAGMVLAGYGFHESWKDIVLSLTFAPLVVPYLIVEITVDAWKGRG